MKCADSIKMDSFDSINYIRAAWDEIKRGEIGNCYRKRWFGVWNYLGQIDSSPSEDENF